MVNLCLTLSIMQFTVSMEDNLSIHRQAGVWNITECSLYKIMVGRLKRKYKLFQMANFLPEISQGGLI